MKRLLSILGMGALLLAARIEGGEKDNKALKAIEGEYVLVKGEDHGKPLTDEQMKNSLLIIKGNKHDVKVGDVTIVGTHKLDASKKPRHIDASDTEGPYKGKTVLGIYKLQGKEFSVCFADPGKDRPTEFTTKSGTGVIYHVWKKK